MKESIRQFAHNIFESELIDKLTAISVNENYIDIKPASREVARRLTEMTNGTNLEVNRDDFHTFRIQEHEPTVQLTLTKEEVDWIWNLQDGILASVYPKIKDLEDHFYMYAE